MITVLMTVYNERKEVLKASIESILDQTFSSFKFLIIIDNPNNKNAIQLIDKYAQSDKRIKYIVNEINMGLPLSLNKGIDLINTKYTVRMDADDISEPTRLEKQLNYMEKNKDIALLGTNIKYMNNTSIFKRASLPESYEDIKVLIRYQNIMCHPTFFIRTDLLKIFKYRNLKYSQDYDLTCRLIEKKYKINNINEYELNYRLVDKDDNKCFYQIICMQTIQKFFKLNILCDVDIASEVNKSIEKVTEKERKNYLIASTYYNSATFYLKKQKYTKFLKCFFTSFIKSKIQRKNIYNIILYKILFYFKIKIFTKRVSHIIKS